MNIARGENRCENQRFFLLSFGRTAFGRVFKLSEHPVTVFLRHTLLRFLPGLLVCLTEG